MYSYKYNPAKIIKQFLLQYPLQTFLLSAYLLIQVNIQTSIDLFDQIPADKIKITESGISSVEAVVSLKKVGYKGFLIGENFMKQPEPSIAFHDFVTALKQAEERNL